MSAVLLVAAGLGYRIAGKMLVEDIALSLRPGRICVVVGPNGAGKSTLLRLLTGELRPSAGTVLIDGQPIGALRPWQLACRRAVMAQASQIAFPFAVHEIVSMALDGVGRSLPATRRLAVLARSLAAADIAHLAERSCQTLSGGEQQRVQFARALCQLEAGRTVEEHQMLFLDEPIASLDLRHQLGLLDSLRDLARQGIAILAILHDLALAAHYADDLLVLSEGRLAAAGPPDEVLTRALLNSVFGVDLAAPRSDALLPQTYARLRVPA